MRQKGCFLMQVFMSIYNCTCKGLQGGTLGGPVFFAFFPECVAKGCRFISRGRRGTSWHVDVSGHASKVAVSMGEAAKLVVFEGVTLSNLKEASHEKLLLRLQRVSSWVSACPLASPCLWGKLQNLSFPKVSQFQNWRKPRTKCSFCIFVSGLRSFRMVWSSHVTYQYQPC